MNKHWSDEDFVNELYGIGPGGSHLDECEECRGRWLQVRERRGVILEQPGVAPGFLAAQRESIQAKLDGRRQDGAWELRLGPALAALSVVVLGIVLSRPAPAPEPTLASNDGEFFTEIYSMVESPEPWVAEPMYEMFED